MAIVSDRQRVDAFKENHTPTEIAIFEAFQRADVLDVVSEPGPQCGEHLGYAEEFILWLNTVPEPYFEDVVAKLHVMYDDFDVFYNPTEDSLRYLADTLCAIIYDQPS